MNVYQYCNKCKTEIVHMLSEGKLYCMICGKESKL